MTSQRRSLGPHHDPLAVAFALNEPANTIFRGTTVALAVKATPLRRHLGSKRDPPSVSLAVNVTILVP